jgi:hypothetical protein
LDNIAPDEGRWVRTSEGVNGASPDSRWLAIFRPYTPLLYVYRLPGLERVAKLTNKANIANFVFSPLGDEVAVGSRAAVEFWSTTTWQRTREITNFVDIVFAQDGRGWWLTRDFRSAALYDARTLEALLPLPTGTLPLALSPVSRHLASAWTRGGYNCGTWPKCGNEFTNWEWIGQAIGEYSACRRERLQ